VPVGGGGETAPGTIPHLLTLLWEEYRKYLAGMPAVVARYRTVDEALVKAPAASFYAFATSYLDANRPVGTFALDRNVGLRLKDNRLVSVALNVDPNSAMAPEGEAARLHAEQVAPPRPPAIPMSSPSAIDHSGAINVM
jgi:hypothetical protein